MTDASAVDVLVIGGGPAGATAAALLASWGRSVVMVHCESDSPSLAESLPASTKKLLRHLGLLEVIEAARFHPNKGNISRWAGREAVAESAESGYHVPRARFDRLLRDHARARGATLVEGRVRKVELASPATIECVGPIGPPLLPEPVRPRLLRPRGCDRQPRPAPCPHRLSDARPGGRVGLRRMACW